MLPVSKELSAPPAVKLFVTVTLPAKFATALFEGPCGVNVKFASCEPVLSFVNSKLLLVSLVIYQSSPLSSLSSVLNNILAVSPS